MSKNPMPLPVYRASYRVLVVRNPESKGTHDRVEAHCLELDLAGRGNNLQSALRDLAETISREFLHEWTQLTPAYSNQPDPLMLEAYEGKRDQLGGEFDGYRVIQKLVMRLEADLPGAVARARAASPQPRVVFEPMAA